MIEIVIRDHTDFAAVGKVENTQCVAVNFFGADEEASFFVLPHLFGLPALQHVLGFGKATCGDSVNRGSDGATRRLLQQLSVFLQKRLDGCVSLLRGGGAENKQQARQEKAEQSPGHWWSSPKKEEGARQAPLRCQISSWI